MTRAILRRPWRAVVAAMVSLGLASSIVCATTYRGVAPVSPANSGVAYALSKKPPVVDNLQPTLEWKPLTDEVGITYDLVVNEGEARNLAGGGWRFLLPARQVYYRENLSQPEHRNQTPLEPNTDYVWAIRIRDPHGVREWSNFDYCTLLQCVFPSPITSGVLLRDRRFPFRTPAAP